MQTAITIACAVIAIVVITVVVYLMFGSAPVQTVASGDTVEVYYTGSFTNGTVFDSNFGKQPLTFTVGSGQLIKGFDDAVIGMGVNETKNVTLSPSEAYGQINPALIVSVPLSSFGNQSVEKGMTVTSNTTGGQVSGTVTSVNLTNVTVDFNSPLAGKTLLFTIKVIGIQKAGGTQ